MPDSEIKDDCQTMQHHSPISTEGDDQDEPVDDNLEEVSSTNDADLVSRHQDSVDANGTLNEVVDSKAMSKFPLNQQSSGKVRKIDQQDFDDFDAEQELMQARRLTLEKAQADLMASFGLNFPMLSGLPYIPPATGTRHPFLPPPSLSGQKTSAIAAADLLHLSSLVYHQHQNNSIVSNFGNHSQNGIATGFGVASVDAERRRRHLSTLTTTAMSTPEDSPEPEDLSMRSPSAATVNQRQLSNRLAASLTKSTLDGDGGMSPTVDSLTPTPTSIGGGVGGSSTATQQQNWSFEEQFKQLYDLGTDQRRKDFLDELFSFMQKRGTPVTRIPIMAKQVLDLYELYKLVVSHGGLVEVINKKLWREITKGLNLPSSITSAAFTLRTQYMKYLYPYECEKEKLSSPGELQSAIDGNRREGRRSGGGGGYHPYAQISPTLLGSRHHVNGVSVTGGLMTDEDAMLAGAQSLTPQQQAFAQAYREQALALEAAQRHFEISQRENQRRNGTSDGASSCSGESLSHDDMDAPTAVMSPPLAPSSDAQTTAAAAAAAYVAAFSCAGGRRPIVNGHRGDGAPSTTVQSALLAPTVGGSSLAKRAAAHLHADDGDDADMADVSAERLNKCLTAASSLLPTTHIKVTGRGDGQGKVDSSLVVSMEINGIMYQGVLFAQPRV